MKAYGTDRKWPFAEGGGGTILLATLLWATAVLIWRKSASLVTKVAVFTSTVLWLLILYFFRDPNRDTSAEPSIVLSPGDGEVVEFAREHEAQYLQTEVQRVSIFLSLFDVHVQRAPLSGRVALVQHQPGKFLQAFRPEASTENEYIAMVLETEFGPLLVKQIAGILARRCVNYMQPGDELCSGQRFGLIRFSSRVDLFLPADANLLVQVGDKVVGGETAIARISSVDI